MDLQLKGKTALISGSTDGPNDFLGHVRHETRQRDRRSQCSGPRRWSKLDEWLRLGASPASSRTPALSHELE